jgi:hypothetical protein
MIPYHDCQFISEPAEDLASALTKSSGFQTPCLQVTLILLAVADEDVVILSLDEIGQAGLFTGILLYIQFPESSENEVNCGVCHKRGQFLKLGQIVLPELLKETQSCPLRDYILL